MLLVPMERMLLVFRFKPNNLNQESKQKEVRNQRKENNPYSLGSTWFSFITTGMSFLVLPLRCKTVPFDFGIVSSSLSHHGLIILPRCFHIGLLLPIKLLRSPTLFQVFLANT
jgi:hypothetical protein